MTTQQKRATGSALAAIGGLAGVAAVLTPLVPILERIPPISIVALIIAAGALFLTWREHGRAERYEAALGAAYGSIVALVESDRRRSWVVPSYAEFIAGHPVMRAPLAHQTPAPGADPGREPS